MNKILSIFILMVFICSIGSITLVRAEDSTNTNNVVTSNNAAPVPTLYSDSGDNVSDNNSNGNHVIVGNDSDIHGCKASAGYSWCDVKSKCLRTWEEPCTVPIVGNDSDIHGCKASAGYSWCDVKSKCLRVWEEKCADPNGNTNDDVNRNSANNAADAAACNIPPEYYSQLTDLNNKLNGAVTDVVDGMNVSELKAKIEHISQ